MLSKKDQLYKTPKPRQKTCKTCKQKFTPQRDFQSTCGKIECAIAHGNKTLKQIHNKAKKEFNENDKRYLKKKAQEVCNKYIRLRDQYLPCISCGHVKGRQFHAGHFRPSGRNQALTFNENNIHKQCSICNNHLSGNLVPYRAALIKKIGLEKVEELESINETKSYTVEELKEITLSYKLKIKELL